MVSEVGTAACCQWSFVIAGCYAPMAASRPAGDVLMELRCWRRGVWLSVRSMIAKLHLARSATPITCPVGSGLAKKKPFAQALHRPAGAVVNFFLYVAEEVRQFSACW